MHAKIFLKGFSDSRSSPIGVTYPSRRGIIKKICILRKILMNYNMNKSLNFLTILNMFGQGL